MKPVLALIQKELLLLFRDKAGLFILFIMPMLLIFVITLMETGNPNKPHKLPLLMMNYDKGDIAKRIETNIPKDSIFKLIHVSPTPEALRKAKTLVAKGKYQVLIIIPKNASKLISLNAKQSLVVTKEKPIDVPPVKIILDPAIADTFKRTIMAKLELVLQQYQMQSMAEVVSDILGTPTAKINSQLIPMKVSYAGVGGAIIKPNPVQQNVPAWSLFGMFFIVIPLASIIIKERDQGIGARLRMAPVGGVTLIGTRIIAFMLINLIQLFLMLVVGIWILPLFGLPSLNVFEHWGLVLIIGTCAAFAATSFGLLIGTYSRTIEQAAALGPILIVIAAAIGGIMLPIYMMPHQLKILSDYSPLYWGQSAFVDVFVRDANFARILPNLVWLILFGVITMILVLFKQSRA